MKKQKKWTKTRHGVISNVARVVLAPVIRIKYGIRVKKFKESKHGQYLVLMNHQTAWDQFFVGAAFHGAVYYVASEDIFSLGFVSKIIRWLVAPIPIKKQTTDLNAVLNCMRVVKEGGTVAMAPEGNRTFSGKTEHINPAVTKLAKKLGLPIAFFRIEGGYGAHPRWSDVIRRGKMRAYVSRVVTPEEYKSLTDDELFELISSELYVDETKNQGKYRHKKTAEYLERAMYVCPFCGLSEFESKNNETECKKCHRKIRYNADTTLSGIGFDFPFSHVADWYDYQNEFVNSLDLSLYIDDCIYTDEDAALFNVILYKHKKLLKRKTRLRLYGDRIEISYDDVVLVLPFAELSAVTVLGKNKLNVYYGDKVYQIKGGKRFNAVKYVNVYFRNKNIRNGEENVKFLGL